MSTSGVNNMSRIITLKIGEALLEAIDELVKRGLYTSRSEAIRAAIKELVKKELWEHEKGAAQIDVSSNGIMYKRVSMQV